jgi:hypothetical protein
MTEKSIGRGSNSRSSPNVINVCSVTKPLTWGFSSYMRKTMAAQVTRVETDKLGIKFLDLE